MGLDVTISATHEWPERVGPFVKLLPDVTWTNYCPDLSDQDVFAHSLPDTWDYLDKQFQKPLLNGRVPINANRWLESGGRLSEWMPTLPTDYHYTLSLPVQERVHARESLWSDEVVPIGVYVSGRFMHAQFDWRIWSDAQWLTFLRFIPAVLGHNCRYVFIGAEWDSDRTTELAGLLMAEGKDVTVVLGQPLSIALASIEVCAFFVSFPSGLGIVANVLRTPTLMLMPRNLPGFGDYADPEDLASGAYRAWYLPTTAEAQNWFSSIAAPHAHTIIDNHIRSNSCCKCVPWARTRKITKRIDSAFSILEPCVHHGDYEADWMTGGNYYEWYYTYANILRPKYILEIGVRYGYSAMSIIAGYPGVRGCVLIDNGCGGVPVECGVSNLCRFCERYWPDSSRSIVGLDRDTQKLMQLPGDLMPEKFDLIHIDAEHTTTGVLHDLELTWPLLAVGGVVIVDDMNAVERVPPGVEAFKQRHPNAESLCISSHTGHELLWKCRCR
jgi:hypothetical protein